MAEATQAEMVAVLERLVTAETPSNDAALIAAGMRVAAEVIKEIIGIVPEPLDVNGRPLLRVRGRDGGVLVLCHFDTVWPAGTIMRWPFTVAGGRATGPGAFDMKAGFVQALFAMRGLTDLAGVTLLVTSDEEIGSPASQGFIEDEARRARCVLVLEPGLGARVKVARKGISMYKLSITGRAAHAGLEPERGINALVELAAQVPVIAAISNTAVGTTVTPTRSHAGTVINTVPAAAEVDIDVRAWSIDEQRRVDAAIRALTPTLPGALLAISGGINRPPLEERRSTALVQLVEQCAAALGDEPLGTARVGGASDGNFTGAIGVPTLDGLGAVGDGAHAEGEYVEVAMMPGRAALLRALIERILAGADVNGHDDASEDPR
ncbi:MAG TPA: M20 family metallopeptidase [Candidatus Dormibacteraeota bacterium]